MNRDHSAALLPSLALLACLLIGGCSFFQAQSQLRGNHVEAEQLKELTPGTSTRADVTALIGSPTGTDIVDAHKPWYLRLLTWSSQAACSMFTMLSLIPMAWKFCCRMVSSAARQALLAVVEYLYSSLKPPFARTPSEPFV